MATVLTIDYMIHRYPSAGSSARATALAKTCFVFAIFGCSYYSQDLLNAGADGSGSSPSSGTAGTSAQGGSAGGQGPIGDMAGNGGVGSGTGSSGGSDAASGAGVGAGGDLGAGGEGGAAGVDADACPDDPEKLAPEQCGCGVAETCAALQAALVHRYDFGQKGMSATDARGDADAAIVGASAAQGKVTFDGSTDAYVDLPNGMISALQDASFEVWLEWGGGSVWTRILDFGVSDEGEGNQGLYPPNYLYLTPSDGQSGNALRAAFSSNGINNEISVRASKPLAVGSTQHLVLVVDDSNDELRLYLNGSLSAMNGFTGHLSSLNDVNNWLGRSNFLDGPLKASIEEFRVYDVALDAALVEASHGFGPNPSFL
jgi:hypothetical protein